MPFLPVDQLCKLWRSSPTEVKGLVLLNMGDTGYWRNTHKLCTLHLLRVSKVDLYRHLRHKEMRDFVEDLRAATEGHEVVNISAKVGLVIEKIIYNMIFDSINFNVGGSIDFDVVGSGDVIDVGIVDIGDITDVGVSKINKIDAIDDMPWHMNPRDHLGEVVFVELPEPGLSLSKGDSFGAVESVKATSDVNTPVSGEVVEVNSKLTDTTGLINTSPYEDGWMIKVKLSSETELDSLMGSKEYTKFCEEEDASH